MLSGQKYQKRQVGWAGAVMEQVFRVAEKKSDNESASGCRTPPTVTPALGPKRLHRNSIRKAPPACGTSPPLPAAPPAYPQAEFPAPGLHSR